MIKIMLQTDSVTILNQNLVQNGVRSRLFL